MLVTLTHEKALLSLQEAGMEGRMEEEE